jgi:hypothetical protein
MRVDTGRFRASWVLSGFTFPSPRTSPEKTPDYRLYMLLRDITNTSNVVIQAIQLNGFELPHPEVLSSQPLGVYTYILTRLQYYFLNRLDSEVIKGVAI